MKSANGKLLAFVAAICFLTSACQKKQNERPVDVTHERKASSRPGLDNAGAGNRTAWLPVGTKFEQIPGGVHCIPPDGWNYIGFTTGGQGLFLKDRPSVTLTCACNIASGICKPFESTGPWGTTRGCLANSCSNCTMTQKVHGNGNYEVARGGYFQPDAPSRLLKNGESAPAIFDALLELPAFQDRLKSFLDKAYRGSAPRAIVQEEDGSVSAPDGFVLTGVSIMGRALAVVLPEGFVKQELGYTFRTKASCNCSNNTGKCVLKQKTIFGMGSAWCEGSCNGCTLKTDTKVSSGASYEVNIFSVAH